MISSFANQQRVVDNFRRIRLSNDTNIQPRRQFLDVSSATHGAATERGAEAPSHEAGGVGCYVELGGRQPSVLGLFALDLNDPSTHELYGERDGLLC